MARKIVPLWSFLCIKRVFTFSKTLFQFDLTNAEGKDRLFTGRFVLEWLVLCYSKACQRV